MLTAECRRHIEREFFLGTRKVRRQMSKKKLEKSLSNLIDTLTTDEYEVQIESLFDAGQEFRR